MASSYFHAPTQIDFVRVNLEFASLWPPATPRESSCLVAAGKDVPYRVWRGYRGAPADPSTSGVGMIGHMSRTTQHVLGQVSQGVPRRETGLDGPLRTHHGRRVPERGAAAFVGSPLVRRSGSSSYPPVRGGASEEEADPLTGLGSRGGLGTKATLQVVKTPASALPRPSFSAISRLRPGERLLRS